METGENERRASKSRGVSETEVAEEDDVPRKEENNFQFQGRKCAKKLPVFPFFSLLSF